MTGDGSRVPTEGSLRLTQRDRTRDVNRPRRSSVCGRDDELRTEGREGGHGETDGRSPGGILEIGFRDNADHGHHRSSLRDRQRLMATDNAEGRRGGQRVT